MAKTKFNHVIASLPPQAAATVQDIIHASPMGDEYKALNALIKCNAPTRHQQQQLLHQTTLGDCKPSKLLQLMRQLHGDGNTDTELLGELFLQCLPKAMCIVLTAMATNTTKTLDDLADTADNMIEVTGPTTSVDNNLPYQIPEQITKIELL